MNLSDKRPILIVEDFADNRQLMVEWVRASGFRAVEAANGWQAVEVALRERPCLILMDLNLPVFDGIEAACLLRENEELKDVPIVAITAYDSRDSRLDAADVGFNEYLTKPIDFTRLECVITRLLRGSKYDHGFR